MADTQLALSRPSRIPSQSSRTSRQTVPAFLQKLYQMLNDGKYKDLLCWSEAGDSFFVLDHERLAREVLGHWFKHQNFSSFVRQLNMYGFHKIPHLQQGVLRSESDTEYWNFTHSNFRRDQPDLLCLIRRKKQSAQQNLDDTTGAIDFRDPNTPTSPSTATLPNPNPTLGLSQGQLLDMHSILQGIAAIKHHQRTISSELTELKENNRLLWQESLASRTKAQKQQEVIDRILKFLAGVFGAHAAGTHRHHHHDDAVSTRGGHDHHRTPNVHSRGAVVPRRQSRLMIEGTKTDGVSSGKVGIVEVEDPEADSTMDPVNTNYAVETPSSIPSPAPSDVTAEMNLHETPSPTSTLEVERTITPTNQHQPQSQQQPQPAFEFNVNPQLQSVLSTLTPDQFTQLFNAMAQSNPGSTGGDLDSSHESDAILGVGQGQGSDGQQLAFPPHSPSSALGAFDFSSMLQHPQSATTTSGSSPFALLEGALHPPSSHSSSNPDPAPPPSSSQQESLIAFDPATTAFPPLSPRLDRHWQSSEDVEKDVSLMDQQINQWMEQFGPMMTDDGIAALMNPGGSDIPSATTTDANNNANRDNTSVDPSSLHIPPHSKTDNVDNQEFDYDQFLHNMSMLDGVGNMGIGGGVDTRFLDHDDGNEEEEDEEDSSTPNASGLATVTSSPVVGVGGGVKPQATSPSRGSQTAATRSRKRKSDVLMGELENVFGNSTPAAVVGDGGVGLQSESSLLHQVSTPIKSKRRKD